MAAIQIQLLLLLFRLVFLSMKAYNVLLLYWTVSARFWISALV